MASGEEILAIPAEYIRANPYWNITGFCPIMEMDLSRLLERSRPRFVLREPAETDPEYKQLVPYVLLKYSNRFVVYTRGKQSGEKRLKGKLSLGIGGHVNLSDGDGKLFPTNPEHTFMQGMRREVAEEVLLQAEVFKDEVVGALYDPHTPVGKVHLGIVFVRHLSSPESVSVEEGALTDMHFETISEIKATPLDLWEGWSQLLVNELDKF